MTATIRYAVGYDLSGHDREPLMTICLRCRERYYPRAFAEPVYIDTRDTEMVCDHCMNPLGPDARDLVAELARMEELDEPLPCPDCMGALVYAGRGKQYCEHCNRTWLRIELHREYSSGRIEQHFA